MRLRSEGNEEVEFVMLGLDVGVGYWMLDTAFLKRLFYEFQVNTLLIERKFDSTCMRGKFILNDAFFTGLSLSWFFDGTMFLY